MKRRKAVTKPETERLAPDVEVLKSDATKYLAVSTTIETPKDYALSAESLKAGKQFVDQVEAAFKPSIDSINESLKKVKSLRDSIINPVKDHRKSIEAARYAYEERAKAAHAKANADMLMLAKQSQESDQEALAAMGLDDMAGQVFMPPPIPAPVPKSQGISARKDWSAEVFDEAALFLAVMNGKAPRESFIKNQPFLNALARAAKTTLNLPGVRAVYRVVTNVRL
jgi:hypothetical protein